MNGKPVAVYTDIVDTDPAAGVAILEEAGFEVRVLASSDHGVIRARAGDADALLVGYTTVDRDLFAALPGLKIVATQSVGVDLIDLDEAARRQIWVTNVPDAATEEVAAHAFAMILALLRGLPFLDRDVRSGIWDGTRQLLHRPSEIALGIVGMGRIGRRLATIAAASLGDIVGTDPSVPDAEWPQGVRRLPLHDLLRSADVVSLHAPLTVQTAHLLDRRALASMRRGAYVVNVSRGGLIDHAALAAGLDEGHLSGAALDVLPTEPPEGGDAVLAHPRVLLSPHAAYVSGSSTRDYVVRQAENIAAWVRSGEPLTPVVGA